VQPDINSNGCILRTLRVALPGFSAGGRMNIRHSIRLALFAAMFLPALTMAQEYRGTILGQVTDPNNAPIVGATIEVTNVETNVSVKTASNSDGNYQVPFLLPGNYKVAVSHTGFKKAERQNVQVATNAQMTLNFTLEVGGASETVTITDRAPLINTANADLGQVIDNSYIGKVAVTLSRNVYTVARLAPGVTGGGGSVTGNDAGKFCIAGGGSAQGRVAFTVDGIPNQAPQNDGGAVYVPSIDSVQEIKVHTTMFDAANASSNGGAINVTTKSGTNALHGTAYIFKRWAALNANTWQNNRLGRPKAPVSFYQAGYQVNGPVWLSKLYNGKDRTFFSTSLEFDNDARDLTRQARVPTDLERKGDFSQTLNAQGAAFLKIFDPSTTVVQGGRATRQEFAGAKIPEALLKDNPTGVAVLNAMPLPNLSGPTQVGRFNWAQTSIYTVTQRHVSARVDHIISEKQRLFVRFGRLIRNQVADDPLIPGIWGFSNASGSSVDQTDLEHLIRRFYNAGVDDTYSFSPTFIGSFRYGFVRKVNTSERGALGFNPADLKLPPVIVNGQAIKGWPVFNLGENAPALGAGVSYDANDVHVFITNFTKLLGSHSLRFGTDYRLTRWNRKSPGNDAPGRFNFDSVFTRSDPFTASSSNTSGSSFASLLLGAPASGALGYNSALSLQNHMFSWFVQDDWKVNQRLTLNFGLRHDLETPYTERYDRISYGFDPNAPAPVQVPGMNLRGVLLLAGVDGAPRRSGEIDKNNFGPRFGFAYSLTPKTVVRGGYGLFYSVQIYNSGFLGGVGVFNAVTPYVASTDNFATPFATLNNPFPSGLRQPIGSAAGKQSQLGDAVSFFDQNRVSPYNQQWQLSVQRELPWGTLFEAAYVGTISLKQLEDFNLNEKPDRFLALGAAENNKVTNPFLGALPPTSVLGQGGTIAQSRLWPQFPQFTNVTLNGANTGRASYHALQMRVDKRLTQGLNFLFTYTFSKLLDNETTSLVNPRRYRTVSSLDQPHILRFAFTYQPPLKFRQKLVDSLLGGWSLSGMLEASSGTPLDAVTDANGRMIRLRSPRIDGDVGERLGDSVVGGVAQNPYFDISAFQGLPNQYTVSPEPPRYGDLRSPATRYINASIFKTFAVIGRLEQLKLQLRVDASNLTNTPVFGNPGLGFNNKATFGVITSGGGPRNVQGALRLIF
jgi:hypothetical protein